MRLRLLLERVRAGESIRIGALGGSITAGQGVGVPERTYLAVFTRWMNAMFPPSKPLAHNRHLHREGSKVAAAGDESHGARVDGKPDGKQQRGMRRHNARRALLQAAGGVGLAVAGQDRAGGRGKAEGPPGADAWSLAGPGAEKLLAGLLVEEAVNLSAGQRRQLRRLDRQLQKASASVADQDSGRPFVYPMYNGPSHRFVDGGVAGTTSAYMSSCMQRHIPPDVDLLLVEYSVNDSPLPSADYKARRPFERLLRKALELPSRPAVVLVHMFAWKNSSAHYWDSAERDFNEFASYYGVPSVSLRAAMVPAQPAAAAAAKALDAAAARAAARAQKGRAAEAAYRAFLDAAGPSAAALLPKALFHTRDAGVHPGYGGHVVVAEVLATLCLELLTSNDRARSEGRTRLGELPSPAFTRASAARGKAGGAGGGAKEVPDGFLAALSRLASRPLPEPMVAGNYPAAHETCYVEDLLTAIVEQPVQGWEWTDEERQKWGWLDTRVTGHVPDPTNPTNPSNDIMLGIAYLESYQGMGLAQVTCVSGCTCPETWLDALKPSRKVSLTVVSDIPVSQHRHCTVAITSAGPSIDAAAGNKFKLLGVVVGEEAGAMTGTVNWLRSATHNAAHNQLHPEDDPLGDSGEDFGGQA
ncbi:hypothetical protein HYH03_000235 [Edaphochlamys debaryana]|uniref:SGNH hydrolase-type esterase domain-containing protein n=1 Tax=Edaphochlamys debaryana TaxID=47281 RepID=A0A835YF82_9CHLO|nr:hypothetical protein HYH03_000235 [Edaphochlamys debaryana]|eukprot:KAG2501735.1 hypothetical protein HYH03_000235 [Edaphochlamys debaryana]